MSNEKTLMVLLEPLEGRTTAAILNGDYGHLNGVAINGNSPENLIDELSELIFNEEGYEKLEFSENVTELIDSKNWDKSIICYFY